MLNTSTINPIASTFRPNLLRLSTCISWIDDAILYENLDDLYHLVSLAPPASTYLGFTLSEASPQTFHRLSWTISSVPSHAEYAAATTFNKLPPSPLPPSGVGSQHRRYGRRADHGCPYTTKPKKSQVSHKKSKTWYVEMYTRIA